MMFMNMYMLARSPLAFAFRNFDVEAKVRD